MQIPYHYVKGRRRLLLKLTIVLAVVAGLLLYKLGSLTHGLALTEQLAARSPVGWHGIYHNPLYLPLKLIRSVVFFFASDHGRFLTRLPNVFFGGLTIISFIYLVRLWHGTRTAIFAGSLFMTSAWVLHASRLASFDVLYLWAVPTLLLINALMQRYSTKALVYYGSLLTWGLLLYIPGMVWLVLLAIYLQRRAVGSGWQHFKAWWQRLGYVLAGLIWLPLLAIDLTRPHQLVLWLGAPVHFAPPLTLLRQFVAVFVHLFVRGPEYPQLWLGKAPLLDVFALIACLAGLYFYIKNRQAARSRILGAFFAIGVLLVALGGPVSLSLLVPILYLLAATGIAYLMRDWLQVFPLNPLARSLGLGLMSLAVALSCLYNLRAYFVAWPHNQTTRITFHYRP